MRLPPALVGLKLGRGWTSTGLLESQPATGNPALILCDKTMNHPTFNISTLRLALSGAMIGIAAIGLISQFPYHDVVGAALGGLSVFIAKAKHMI